MIVKDIKDVSIAITSCFSSHTANGCAEPLSFDELSIAVINVETGFFIPSNYLPHDYPCILIVNKTGDRELICQDRNGLGYSS